MLDVIPNILGVYDSGLRLRYLNKSDLDLFGHRLSEVVGRRDPEVLGPEMTSAYWPLLEEAAQKLQATTSPSPTVLPGRTEGEDLLCGITYTPVTDDAGNAVAFVGITNSLFVQRRDDDSLYFQSSLRRQPERHVSRHERARAHRTRLRGGRGETDNLCEVT